MQTKKIGLVLSGGGHRGVAHAGAIKALEEHGVLPTIISGTSAGALVGALYAAEYPPEEIVSFFKNAKIFSFSRYSRKKPGFLDMDTFRKFLLEYFPDNSFDSLQKKLYVTTTDLLKGTTKVFHKGDLISSILASASFPGVFTPVSIDGSLYSDGGILDNFPIDPIEHLCEKIYGIYVSPSRKMKMEDFKHSYDVMERAYYLKIHNSSVEKFSRCHLVIYPDKLSNYGLFKTNHLDEIFEIGYRATKEKLKNTIVEGALLKESGVSSKK